MTAAGISHMSDDLVNRNSQLPQFENVHLTDRFRFIPNFSSPLYQNFSEAILAEAFKDAPEFPLNDPLVLQRKYLKVKDDPNAKQGSTTD